MFIISNSNNNQNKKKRLFVQIIYIIIGIIHMLLCPYTKVEESFNIQATHDCFYDGIKPAIYTFYNINTNNNNSELTTLPLYDHLQYPGVVPRTFIGPIMLSTVCHIIRYILLPVYDIANNDPMIVLFITRLILFLMITKQWFLLADAIDQRINRSKVIKSQIGTYLLLITVCQFHIPFYMSRMLPNTFACIFTVRSTVHWMRGRGDDNNNDFEMIGAVVDMTIAAILFRCDMILLLFTTTMTWIITKQLSILKIIITGIITSIITLGISILIDSAMWQRYLWPEGEVLYYNTILNKSSEWGIMSWHWYFTSALPKSLLLSLFLIPLSFIRIPEFLRQNTTTTSNPLLKNLFDTTWIQFLIPALCFITLYSYLGHKEVRFIFPSIHLFNISAAIGMNRLYINAYPPLDKEKVPSTSNRILYWLGIIALIISFIVSSIFVTVSKSNYPGGHALDMLIKKVSEQVSERGSYFTTNVYIDNASAMTGVTRFGQHSAEYRVKNVQWNFDKAGYETEHSIIDDKDWSTYTHILIEDKSIVDNLSDDVIFDIVAVAKGNPKLDLRNAKIITEDVIYVLERRDWQNNF